MIKNFKGENGKYGVVVLSLVWFEPPQSILGTLPPVLLNLHKRFKILCIRDAEMLSRLPRTGREKRLGTDPS